MKTQEEIEKLAEQRFPINQNSRNSLLVDSGRQRGFEEGYTQCQEDMTDYIKQAIEYGYQLRCNHKPINSGIDWVKEFNSLNKQD